MLKIIMLIVVIILYQAVSWIWCWFFQMLLISIFFWMHVNSCALVSLSMCMQVWSSVAVPVTQCILDRFQKVCLLIVHKVDTKYDLYRIFISLLLDYMSVVSRELNIFVRYQHCIDHVFKKMAIVLILVKVIFLGTLN